MIKLSLMPFHLDNLTFCAEWSGVYEEAHFWVHWAQDQYITKHLRSIWTLPGLRKLVVQHVKLLFTKYNIEYDEKHIYIKQKVVLVGTSPLAAIIFLKEPRIEPR